MWVGFFYQLLWSENKWKYEDSASKYAWYVKGTTLNTDKGIFQSNVQIKNYRHCVSVLRFKWTKLSLFMWLSVISKISYYILGLIISAATGIATMTSIQYLLSLLAFSRKNGIIPLLQYKRVFSTFSIYIFLHTETLLSHSYQILSISKRTSSTT